VQPTTRSGVETIRCLYFAAEQEVVEFVFKRPIRSGAIAPEPDVNSFAAVYNTICNLRHMTTRQILRNERAATFER
jgi:hypothetical protein